MCVCVCIILLSNSETLFIKKLFIIIYKNFLCALIWEYKRSTWFRFTNPYHWGKQTCWKAFSLSWDYSHLIFSLKNKNFLALCVTFPDDLLAKARQIQCKEKEISQLHVYREVWCTVEQCYCNDPSQCSSGPSDS